jgi:hypothetical protein
MCIQRRAKKIEMRHQKGFLKHHIQFEIPQITPLNHPEWIFKKVAQGLSSCGINGLSRQRVVNDKGRAYKAQKYKQIPLHQSARKKARPANGPRVGRSHRGPKV